MPRRYSTAEVEAALLRIGLAVQRQRGSHMRFFGHWRSATRYVTLVAGRREVDPKTLASVCRQAGITREELHRLVSGEQITE